MKNFESIFVALSLFCLLSLEISCLPKRSPISDRPIVVLTFDDAVKSHRSFVAPLLQEYGFHATFFVTYAWMDDTINFMNWKDIADLHEMGFEIGNHSWTHADFSQPRQAFELEGELGLIEWLLKQQGIPKPVSYAHTGNAFGPEAIRALSKLGYRFARRGKQPEVEYASLKRGPGFDPEKHHPLLIPTTIDFYPGMNLELLQKALRDVPAHEIPILQFHGVPDSTHPWVNTLEVDFRAYMDYLKGRNYRVISMKELETFLPDRFPEDPLLKERYPASETLDLKWPDEVLQSRSDQEYWLRNMKRHRFTHEEMADVLGLDLISIDKNLKSLMDLPDDRLEQIEVIPFPGGRHPRIDFQEGMLSPRRGTKLSVFLPWDNDDYVVLDVPEAVSTQFGLTFLGHKHIPTVFDLQKVQVPNSEWKKDEEGNYENLWSLPNGMEVGAYVSPQKDRILMRLWLTNNTSDTILQDLQTQVCVMLGQTKNFSNQTNHNKKLTCPVVAVQSKKDNQWIITGWQGCSNPWGNKDCPCLHADPSFPDCAPGQTVSINGILWFYSGDEIDREINRMRSELEWL
ncbi:MAG: polysaccharide deacetylase family protein [Saprospiraceae bacterium]|nr:polysaccharide deacetylase family protein [Saprospiraceae bacterium]